MKPTIIVHDVLQARMFSDQQTKIFEEKTPFEFFKEALFTIGKYNLKMVALGNGVDLYPDWVRLIKVHGWEVQCHGLIHHDMHHMTAKEIYEELSEAVCLLENAFNQKITQFYPPRMKSSPAMFEACQKLGLSLMINRYHIENYLEDRTIPEFYIHYWSKRQMELCHQLDTK